jgi:hypothetical protein
VHIAEAVGNTELAEPMQRILFGTPGLLARYLEKLERVQGAAQHAWLAGGAKEKFAVMVDRAMAAVRPRG